MCYLQLGLLREGMAMDVTNVVRFPIERRETLNLLYTVIPDPREVIALAETYDLAIPLDLQDRADLDAAEHIAKQALPDSPARWELLRSMVNQAVSIAIASSLRARRTAGTATTARFELRRIEGLGAVDFDGDEDLRQLSFEAAEATAKAYGHALAAFGVARAVDLATRGVTWTPRLVENDVNWLIDAEISRRRG